MVFKSSKNQHCTSKAYDSLAGARKELRNYFGFYNKQRRHQGLGKKFPEEIYCGTLQQEKAA
ncbi:MAG: hypothetical protein BM485_11240 [Desulfobulbaceae bacterium DB1]|nr:MAG: hypothetical protein BM485_11240 [Desulfobulbaceae bacterium DB1]